MKTTTKCPGTIAGEGEHCYHQTGIKDTGAPHGLLKYSRCCRCESTATKRLA